jgi:hypothetical protein
MSPTRGSDIKIRLRTVNYSAKLSGRATSNRHKVSAAHTVRNTKQFNHKGYERTEV